MKFLLITREFPPNVLGGVGYHCYYLARNLVELGHEVRILTSKDNSHQTDSSGFNFTDIEIEKIQYKNLPGPRYWFNKSVIDHFDKKSYPDVDIIHSHEFIDFSKIKTDKKILLKVHFNLNKKSEFNNAKGIPQYLEGLAKAVANQTVWKKERYVERKALETSDYRIYNSNLTKEIYKHGYCFDDSKFEIVYNGVDPSTFVPDEESSKADYLLYLGGSDSRKGSKELINSYEKEEKMTNLKIIGDFKNNKLRKKANALNNTEIIGRVDQHSLIKYYQNSKALVHPAKYEPFGNVILESLACGTPVIVSNKRYCGAAEILDETVSKTIEPESPFITEAIMNIDKNSINTDKCRSIAEKYTWRRVAKKTILAAKHPL